MALDLNQKLDEAEGKAWKALAGYKFWMFGYWAAIWVHLNQLADQKRRNPFTDLVHIGARQAASNELIQKFPAMFRDEE